MPHAVRKRTIEHGSCKLVWTELVEAHEALIRSPEAEREAAWTRFLNALLAFLSE